jgi:hypothetical protein
MKNYEMGLDTLEQKTCFLGLSKDIFCTFAP